MGKESNDENGTDISEAFGISKSAAWKIPAMACLCEEHEIVLQMAIQ
jgi:hypothetical protein